MFRVQPLAAAAAIALPCAAVAAPETDPFNPALGVILDGRYADFDRDPEAYELPGFMLGGEAGPGESGFALGHTELIADANVDDLFYGRLTVAVHEHDGETEVETEEAYGETLGLGHGLTARFGRFFSGIGYLNDRHPHAWDFVDAPLVYRGLFGDQLRDDGVQVRWVAPTPVFLQFGAELTQGDRFPAAGGDADAAAAFVKVGGDVGISHSWQAGLSWWGADVAGREGGGHGHDAAHHGPAFTGDSEVAGVDFVWKWAPRGNPARRNFKLQFEWFQRDEDGTLSENGSVVGSYDGTQSGWYAQAVYQFRRGWRVGLRYDRLHADNSGTNAEALAEAGLDEEGHTPERASVMVDYARSETSRLRLQYNQDRSYPETDRQVLVQYVLSLGAHGAHRF